MIILVFIVFIKLELFKILKLFNYFDFGEMIIYYVLIVWLVMIFFGVFVGWFLFVVCILYFVFIRWKVVYFVVDKLVYSLDSFSFLSVLFFIFIGILMNGVGIIERIFNFVKVMLGYYIGGMGYVNVVVSLIFFGMFGLVIVDVGGLG